METKTNYKTITIQQLDDFGIYDQTLQKFKENAKDETIEIIPESFNRLRSEELEDLVDAVSYHFPPKMQKYYTDKMKSLQTTHMANLEQHSRTYRKLLKLVEDRKVREILGSGFLELQAEMYDEFTSSRKDLVCELLSRYVESLELSVSPS